MKPLLEESQPFDQGVAAAYADAAAVVWGMNLRDDCRHGVIANLQLILNQSAALMALDLDPTVEAAPVFRP